MADSSMQRQQQRKRTRLCKHCGKYLTYPVYKKHKEGFYNPVTKEWIVRGIVKNKMYSEEVDAEDDEIIRDSLNAQGTYN